MAPTRMAATLQPAESEEGPMSARESRQEGRFAWLVKGTIVCLATILVVGAVCFFVVRGQVADVRSDASAQATATQTQGADTDTAAAADAGQQ